MLIKTAFAQYPRVRLLSAAETAWGYSFFKLRLSVAETVLGYCFTELSLSAGTDTYVRCYVCVYRVHDVRISSLSLVCIILIPYR